MISLEEKIRFLFDLERGSFEGCRELKNAYEGKKTNEYLMGVYYPTAEQVEKIWEEVVHSIKGQIKLCEKRIKEVDHYWRYLHGLTVLGIKDKSCISNSSRNVKLQIAYELWQLDDGEYFTEDILDRVSWCFAEICKNRIDMSHMLENNSRHKNGRQKRVYKSLMQNEYLINAGINLQNKEEVESYVDSFCNKLENKKMSLEEYVQHFHVLTLLGVPKYSEKVPAINTTKAIYDIAYELWGLDTSERNWNIIEKIANLSSKL